jgi:hypothetical protein
VNLTGILADLMTAAFQSHADMSIVDAPGQKNLRDAVERSQADVIIWRLDDVDVPDADPELFARHPRVKVLAVQDDGRRFVFWELRPHRTALGELPLAEVADLVRRRCCGDGMSVHPRVGRGHGEHGHGHS